MSRGRLPPQDGICNSQGTTPGWSARLRGHWPVSPEPAKPQACDLTTPLSPGVSAEISWGKMAIKGTNQARTRTPALQLTHWVKFRCPSGPFRL